MPHIHVLDQITIDKIAAGEVIERPASIVKELVENAIDAGSTSVTVEIKDGGISFIRIRDNGCGIPKEEVKSAFLRHSTSKIETVEDLSHIASLGFRGEALSSIAAVTRTEVITKTKDSDLGTKYVIEGGKEVSLEETGAPDGTTFLVHQLFYNVPARRKFLKTPMTEAGHVQDLLMHLALSHPEVALQFLNNGQEKLRTSGNGKLKDVIYQIYGRDVAANLIELDYEKGGLRITGFLGKPVITRGNRNFENFFVNGRYVKSGMISKALEDAYRALSLAAYTAIRHLTVRAVSSHVKNKETKEPIDEYGLGNPNQASVIAKCKELGFYTYGRDNVVQVCPPLIITEEELREAMKILDEVLTWADEQFCK